MENNSLFKNSMVFGIVMSLFCIGIVLSQPNRMGVGVNEATDTKMFQIMFSIVIGMFSGLIFYVAMKFVSKNK